MIENLLKCIAKFNFKNEINNVCQFFWNNCLGSRTTAAFYPSLYINSVIFFLVSNYIFVIQVIVILLIKYYFKINKLLLLLNRKFNILKNE